MDTVAVILEGLRVILGFLMLFFVPGFALTLIIFPHFTEIGIIKRLVYSTVLSIGSVITLVLFMYVVLGVGSTPENIIFVIAAFSSFACFGWLLELWYLNSRLKNRLEPQISADYQKLQRYYSRKINAARDRFRQDTRTVVVYHEHQQSGLYHINHSYLIDIGEEIDIRQVIENKLKVTDSVIVRPPYPRTRYFELAIREYKEDRLSLVDDLQVVPVLVTKTPGKILLGFIRQQDTVNITERIHKKNSTSEVQWIYSHDFHIFAIIHAEDTRDQMVNRIIGKLDEIALSIKSGIHISSHAEDRQILREAFDAVIEKPRDTPVKPLEIARQPEVQFSAEPREILKRPVILESDEPREILTRPNVRIIGEPKEILTRPVIQTSPEPKAIHKRPNVQIIGESKEILKHSNVQIIGKPGEILTRPVIQTRAEPEVILTRPVIRTSTEPREIDRRKLQKKILQDLNTFGLTPDSFDKCKRNIEKIKIPEKMDIKKHLVDVEGEIKDLNWLYE